MTFLITVALGFLAVAVFHIVAGWVLANGLRSKALDVKERPQDPPGIWIVGYDQAEIVLTADEPRQDIGHPGTTAIVYPRGTGRLGDVVRAVDLRVTRRVIEMSGEPSICSGPVFEDCDAVTLDPYVFLTDPSEVGLEFEETTYVSELGDIGAWKISGPNSGRWAVHTHGWTADRRELLRIQPAFHQAGYTSLVIDYRNDATAPEDPTGRYHFGLTEWRDLEGAVTKALDEGATDIVLTGCSTGGALVMAFLENSELASHVSGIVLDAPNIILADAIRLSTQDVKATQLMLEFGMWIADLRWNIDWDQTNFVQRAEKYLEVPALVFHGTSDHRVPISVSRQLKARVPEKVELIEFPAAGHVMSWNADPERYEKTLGAFLRRIQN